MTASHLKLQLLNLAAVLIGLCVPSLIFGRAVIGVTLGLSIILCMIAANHREAWQTIRPHFSQGFIALIAITMICSAFNIPFSLRIDLSWEAWARTWLLMGVVYYLLFCLRNHTALIITSMTVTVGLVCAYGTLNAHEISKPLMNGLLLTLPLCVYQYWKKHNTIWLLLCGFTIIAYIACALETSSKASLAGLIFIILSSTIIFGLTRLGIKKTALIFGILVVIITAGLMVWLPENLNDSSTLNEDAAPLPIWLVDFHRQLIWMFSIDLAEKSPWVGFGLNASNYHPDAQATVSQYFAPRFQHLKEISTAPVMPGHSHNWIIEMLVDGGVVALLPVLACVLLLFYYAIKNYIRTSHPAILAFLAVNIGYWGTGLLNFSFWSVWWQAIYFVTSALCFVLYVQRDEVTHGS
ncbi:MAG: O-antigen ligase family protein [Methylocystaceae bacterium]|nr:O-antigen ligase family protein [Methylocystaceae bacterium]